MEMRNAVNFVTLSGTMRELWEQHVHWTRSFVVSAAADLPDLDLVVKRLLRNPMDFAKVLSVFYGKEKANRFNELLTDHLTIAATLVNYAKAGDTDNVNKTRDLWYKNAADIAAFLASINPFWDQNKWRKMLFEHLRLLEEAVVNRLSGNFEAEINGYDAIEDMALMMGDYMAEGIYKQFGGR